MHPSCATLVLLLLVACISWGIHSFCARPSQDCSAMFHVIVQHNFFDCFLFGSPQLAKACRQTIGPEQWNWKSLCQSSNICRCTLWNKADYWPGFCSGCYFFASFGSCGCVGVEVWVGMHWPDKWLVLTGFPRILQQQIDTCTLGHIHSKHETVLFTCLACR